MQIWNAPNVSRLESYVSRIPENEVRKLNDYACYAPQVVTAKGPDRQKILEEAGRYIGKDRNSAYGEPEDNFQTIAEMWETYLTRRFGIRIPIRAYDVAPMMTLVKIARLANYPLHHDSYVDTVGYGAAGGEVAGRARSRGESPSNIKMAELLRALEGHDDEGEEEDEDIQYAGLSD
jgi:hypothetical protein